MWLPSGSDPRVSVCRDSGYASNILGGGNGLRVRGEVLDGTVDGDSHNTGPGDVGRVCRTEKRKDNSRSTSVTYLCYKATNFKQKCWHQYLLRRLLRENLYSLFDLLEENLYILFVIFIVIYAMLITSQWT